MGYGVGYICQKCKHEKDFLCGVGFNDFDYQDNNFKKLIEIGKKEQLQNINQLLNFIKLENVYLKSDYKHDVYVCTKCKNLHNKFRYTLISNNNRFIPKYKCNYCGNNLKIKKEQENFNITCDNCGSTKFEEELIDITWD